MYPQGPDTVCTYCRLLAKLTSTCIAPRLPPSLLLAPESPPIPQPPAPYSPSREDVVATRAVLRNFLPLDITDIILNIAEYYPRLISVLPPHHLDNPLTVSEGRRQVVVSPPIQRPDSISRVLIQTESHDQGWSSYPQDQGTFRNSWTWLDLGVVRNTSGGIPAPEWRIYTNVHASDEWQPKEVILDISNETVGALLPGDSLAIWAGARCVFCDLSTMMISGLLLMNKGFLDG
jgi:hypothetical protein